MESKPGRPGECALALPHPEIAPAERSPLPAAHRQWKAEMTKADQYRKRATTMGARIKKGPAAVRAPILKKQKALTDMADNEDWLNGINTQAKD